MSNMQEDDHDKIVCVASATLLESPFKKIELTIITPIADPSIKSTFIGQAE